MKIFTPVLFLSIIAVPCLFAQAGSLDASFGVAGKVITELGPWHKYASGIAFQADGKIVVAVSPATFGNDNDFVLVRYHPNGSLDNTFDGDGIVRTDFNSLGDRARDVVVLADGKILVVGSTHGPNNTFQFALARYNPDGSLDNSFDQDGKLTTIIDSLYQDLAESVLVQSDGKIVVSGVSYASNNDSDFAVARYHPDGSLDYSFSVDGKVKIDFGTYTDALKAMAIQSDGKIVVVGSTDGGAKNFALARLNPDGSLDNSFDNDGKRVDDMGSTEDIPVCLAVQADGKILVGGRMGTMALLFILIRYHADGSPDLTFGANGVVNTAFSLAHAGCNAILVQPDGKIVAAGTTIDGMGKSSSCLSRYNVDGNLDPTFGTGGKIITNFGITQNSGIRKLAWQADGKIIAAGHTRTVTADQLALARYHSGLIVSVSELPQSDYAARVYPNPVETDAVIEYTLQQEENVSIRLLDSRGKLLGVLLDGQKQAVGKHVCPLKFSREVPAGIYFLHILTAGGGAEVRVLKL